MRELVRKRHKRPQASVHRRFQRMRQRMQRRAETLRRMFVRFLMAAVPLALLLTVGVLLFSPMLHVQEMRIERTDARIDVEQIQEALAPLFGKHLFFLSQQEVRVLVREAVPDLESLTVTKQYPSSLSLHLTIDPVAARLIIDDPDNSGAARSGSGSDFLSEHGMYVVYSDAQVQASKERTSSGVLLPVIHIVDWGVRPQPWQALIDRSMLDVMNEAEPGSLVIVSSVARSTFVRGNSTCSFGGWSFGSTCAAPSPRK